MREQSWSLNRNFCSQVSTQNAIKTFWSHLANYKNNHYCQCTKEKLRDRLTWEIPIKTLKTKTAIYPICIAKRGINALKMTWVIITSWRRRVDESRRAMNMEGSWAATEPQEVAERRISSWWRDQFRVPWKNRHNNTDTWILSKQSTQSQRDNSLIILFKIDFY